MRRDRLCADLCGRTERFGGGPTKLSKGNLTMVEGDLWAGRSVGGWAVWAPECVSPGDAGGGPKKYLLVFELFSLFFFFIAVGVEMKWGDLKFRLSRKMEVGTERVVVWPALEPRRFRPEEKKGVGRESSTTASAERGEHRVR